MLLVILSVTLAVSSSPVNADHPLRISTAVVDPCDVDFNGSGEVDVGDILLVANCWRSTDSGCDRYNLDGDDDIDIVDIMLVAAQWGRRCGAGGVPLVGMSLNTMDPAVLARMSDADVRWGRTSIAWSSVEPSNLDLTNPANGNWPDGWLQTLIDTYDITPLVLVWKNPTWAATTSCGPIDSLSEFAEFVHALAARYDGDGDYNNDGTVDGPPLPEVLYFELYNEPDFDPNQGDPNEPGGCWGGNGAAYAEMLRTAYLAMKGGVSAGNPQAQILFGSVAYERFYNAPSWYYSRGAPSGPFDYDFVGDVLAHLQTKYGSESEFPFFDIMNFHFYNDFRNAWDGPTMPYNQDLIGKVKHLQEDELAAYGLESMPFFNSEISLPSAPTDTWTNRSEEYQAQYMVQGMVRGMVVDLVGNIWFELKDAYSYGGNCNFLYSWLMMGILRSKQVDEASDACPSNPLPGYACAEDNCVKPVYEALQVLTQSELSGAVYDRQLTEVETGSRNIEAYRFTMPDGGKKIVVWTDTGERIGKKGVSPLTRNMVFNASHFDGEWTGQLRVVNKLGTDTVVPGSTSIGVTQSPIYVEVYP
jgi:hypothetical protein